MGARNGWTRKGKGWSGRLAALGALLVLAATSAQAQDRLRQGPRGPGAMSGPEGIMALRDTLDLTEEQLAALDELRAEAVDVRSRRQAERGELMSRFRAGEIDRGQLRSALEEMRAAPGTAQERRDRIEGVLTDDQRELLIELRQRRRMRALRSGPRAWRRGGPALDRPGRAFRRGAPRAWRERGWRQDRVRGQARLPVLS